MKNKKGFTLIELLAVIVILGLLMAIAIPSVTKYITESRKKTVVSTIGNYITAMVNEVNDLTYTFTEANTIYAVPIECIALERGGTNPFGEWHQASNAYWAYVLVQYDDETSSYKYGYTFKDSAGYGLYPTTQEKMNEQGKQIQTGLELTRPVTGKITNITALSNWSGFNVNYKTNLFVLTAEKEGNVGDGINTCTLQQKGKNYEIAIAETIEIPDENVLMKGNKVNSSDTTFFNSKYKRSEVEAIYTINNLNIPENAIDSWDVSAAKNGKVIAWLLDHDNDKLYELYIGATNKIIANPDSNYLFQYFTNVTTMDLSNLVTSKVTTMLAMFANCSSLKNLDLSNFDTTNVINMYYMFNRCSSLISLNLSSFNTSKVTTMRTMFQGCTNLISLDLNSFNTSRVTDMSYMFSECHKLNSLKIQNFDTSKVTLMRQMFYNCKSLTSLDLSNFNTSKVTDMALMFRGCEVLKSLNIGSFNTSKVTTMYAMFAYCYSLTNLDLSGFITTEVTDMQAIFRGNNKLLTIDIRQFDFAKATNYINLLDDVPINSRIIVKDAQTRNWIQKNIGSNYQNIVTIDEL